MSAEASIFLGLVERLACSSSLRHLEVAPSQLRLLLRASSSRVRPLQTRRPSRFRDPRISRHADRVAFTLFPSCSHFSSRRRSPWSFEYRGVLSDVFWRLLADGLAQKRVAEAHLHRIAAEVVACPAHAPRRGGRTPPPPLELRQQPSPAPGGE